MKKIVIWAQIITVIIIAVLILYNQFKSIPPPDYHPERWNSWDGFLAISYSGISNKNGKGNINRKKLFFQLKALKNEGYETITPDDIIKYLNKKRGLPKKPLFIMFEENRKESYLYAKRILEELGFMATMAVPASLIKKGGIYLKYSELKKLVKNSHWFLASMGDRAIIGVPTDSTGTIDHFLSHRAFVKGRYETDIEFRTRIIKDYSISQSILSSISGKPVKTYLYPYSDPGTGRNSDPIAEELNLRAVKKFYKLAFISSDNPLNGPNENPYSLTRLRIPAAWDSTKLIEELNNFLPRQKIKNDIADYSFWVKTGKITKSGYLLSPNSSLWLKGSDTWKDIKLSLKLTLSPRANFIIFIRYTSKDSFFSLGLDNKFIYVREKTKNNYQTILRKPINIDEDNFHNIKIIAKGKRVVIFDNGNPISEPIPVSSSINHGKIGFLAQKASVKVLDFKASRLNELFIFTNDYNKLPKKLKEKVSRLIPLWFSDKNIINNGDTNLLSNKSMIYNIFIGLYDKRIEAESVVNYLKKYWFEPKKEELSDIRGNKIVKIYLGPFDSIEIAKINYNKLKKMGFEAQIRKMDIKGEIINHNTKKGIQNKIYYVNAGFFNSYGKAQKLFKDIKSSGFTAKLQKFDNKVFKFKIFLGPYNSKQSANKVAAFLTKEKGLKTSIAESNKDISLLSRDKKTPLLEKEFSSSIKNRLKTFPVSIKIGTYTNTINSSAIYDFLKSNGFPVYEREFSNNENNRLTDLFVGPFIDYYSLKKALSELENMGFSTSITPIFLNETQKINLLQAASTGIKTSPIIKIEKRINKQAAEHLVQSILEELHPSAVKLLLKSFTVYGIDGEIHKALHKFGFRLIRIITPAMAIKFSKEKQQLFNDILLIDGDEISTRKALILLLKTVPKDNIVVNIRFKRKFFKGMKRFERLN